MSDLPVRNASARSVSGHNDVPQRLVSNKSNSGKPSEGPLSPGTCRSHAQKLELPHVTSHDWPSSPKKLLSPTHSRSSRRAATISAATVEKKTVVSGESGFDSEEDERCYHPSMTLSRCQPTAQGLLRDLVDGQHRLEEQVAHLSGRCTEDFQELKVAMKNFVSRYDHAVIFKANSCGEEMDQGKHVRKPEVTFKMLGSEDSANFESTYSMAREPIAATRREASEGAIPTSLSGDSAVGSSLVQNELVICVDSAEVNGCEDSSEFRCVVRLDKQEAFKTTLAQGSSPQWHHRKPLEFNEEVTVEFVVMVTRSGSEEVFGVAALQLSDCHSGFTGNIDLIKEASQAEGGALVTDALVGSLSVSLDFNKPADLTSMNRVPSRLRRPTTLDMGSTLSSSTTPMKSLRSAGRRASLHWPMNIDIRPQLEAPFEEQNTDQLEQTKWDLRQSVSSGPSFFKSDRAKRSDGSKCGRILPVMNPTSKKRLAYDMFSLLVLLHDMISIPYTLAWNVAFEGWFKVASWFTCIFWLGDVCCSFFTGYCEDGQVVTYWNRVALHYLKTWFWLDVPLVVVDFICVFGSEYFAGGIWRISRIFRFIRIISLFRVFRITTNFDNVLDRTLTDAWRSIYVVSWLIIALLWIGHVVCCFWFWLGFHGGSAPGFRWFDALDWRNTKFISEEPDYQYFTSLHWSLSQIAGGGVEVITPRNTYERIFNVVLIVFGVLFGTTLVSILSTTMIEIRMSQQERNKNLRAVRQYLVQNKIHPNLAMRVQKNLNEHFKKEKRLSQKEVKGLDHLSKFLRMELRFAIVGPHILRHPLFNLFYKLDTDTMQIICYEIVRNTAHPPQDMVFKCGDAAEDAFYIVAGKLEYSLNPMSTGFSNESLGDDDVDGGQLVQPDEWLALAALWTQWKYVGNAVALVLTELITINSEGLLEVIVKHGSPAVIEICREYGQLYHRCVITSSINSLTDLDVPRTNYQDMVVEMRENVRVIVGMVALAKIKKDRWLPFHGELANLESEVLNGKSIVLENYTREVERIVAVAVLSLLTEDGRILLQLAKLSDGKIKFAPRMPGGHQPAGESSEDALRKYIATELAFLKDHIIMDDVEETLRQYETKDSGTFGIRTTYIRSTTHFHLHPDGPLIPSGEQLRRSGNMNLNDFSSSVSLGTRIVDASPVRASQVEFPTNDAVFTVQSKNGNGMNVYAWVQKKDQDFFLKPSNEQHIMRWLESIEFDPAFRVRRNSRGNVPVALSDAFHPFSVLDRLVGQSPQLQEAISGEDRKDGKGLQPLNDAP